MKIRWDLHREVLGHIGGALRFFLPRAGAGILFAAIMLASALLLGPVGVIAVLALGICSIWYWAEYHEAKRRDDLRERTKGTCG